MELFDGLRSGLAHDRAQFYREFAVAFYGANRPDSKVSQGVLDQFWLWSMMAGLENSYACVKAFSETEFYDDLKSFDIPTLLMHGEDDQIVPIDISSRRSARLIEGAAEIYYSGLPHGLMTTHPDVVNRDLLAFCKAGRRAQEFSSAAR